ncbi:MAG: energy transducer TonB [Pseudomonadota bacterium]
MSTSTVPMQQEASENDKLTFTIFLAAAFHLIVLLGVSFQLPDASESDTSPTLEVMLANTFTDQTIEDADFIGQANQEGGGNVDDKHKPTVKEKPDFSEPTPNELSKPQVAQSQTQKQVETEILTTRSPDAPRINRVEPQPLEEKPENELSQADIYKRAFEIASLEAEIADEQEAYAKRPRKTFIRANVQANSHAFYLAEWTERIESVGNRIYPEEAKRRKIYGQVVVSVSIAQDGSLVDSKVLTSSGHKVLDDAALRIVRHAAPFSPLTQEIRKDTDILVITRVWEFQSGNRIKTRS